MKRTVEGEMAATCAGPRLRVCVFNSLSVSYWKHATSCWRSGFRFQEGSLFSLWKSLTWWKQGAR